MSKKTKTICTVAALIVLALLIVMSENSGSMLRSVLQYAAIYALAAVSMNLLNGFTGLFSLGTAGFMALGAYAYAVVTIPVSKKATVYYLYGVADWLKNVELTPMIGLIIGGLVAALCAFLIGLPVLRLKSDYFAIATLGFAEIVRIVVGSSPLNKVTNGSLGMNNIPKFESYYTTFIVVIVCIAVCVLLINSSYGRAFKAIREDEIAAETMGINLAKHKRMSFVASSFFAGISGAMLAMYQASVQATTNVSGGYNFNNIQYQYHIFRSAYHRNRRTGQHYRQHHILCNRCICKRMVAEIFRLGYIHRRLADTFYQNRLQNGSVLCSAYGCSTVLAKGHYGPERILMGRNI